MRETKGRPGLKAKKTLLVHNYDLFLQKQTSLFACADSRMRFESVEIMTRFEIMLLDDITIFAISCRRLIELCGLQGAADKSKIPSIRFDLGSETYCFERMQRDAIGFRTLLNCIIHMSYFECYYDWSMLRKRPSEDIFEFILKKKDPNKSIMPICLLLRGKDDRTNYYALKDIVIASVAVAERIIDTCSEAGIYLEVEYRGLLD